MRAKVALLAVLAACDKPKPPDPLLAGAIKVQQWSELEQNVGKKVYLSGRTSNVNERAAIEIPGGVVFVGQTSEWDSKMGRAYITGVGTVVKEEGDKPTYLLQDFKARGMR